MNSSHAAANHVHINDINRIQPPTKSRSTTPMVNPPPRVNNGGGGGGPNVGRGGGEPNNAGPPPVPGIQIQLSKGVNVSSSQGEKLEKEKGKVYLMEQTEGGGRKASFPEAVEANMAEADTPTVATAITTQDLVSIRSALPPGIDDEVFSVTHENPAVPPTLSSFVIGSGASVHVTPFKTDFFHIDMTKSTVIQGVGGLTDVKTTGSICFTVNGRTVVLHNVLYDPTAQIRLLSVALLCDSLKCNVTFSNEAMILHQNGQILVSGSRIPGCHLYSITTSSPSRKPLLPNAFAYTASRIPTLETWHGRLGHAGHQTVLDMATSKAAKNMSLDLSSLPGSCRPCILGKQVMTSIPKARVGPGCTRRLEKVYVDLTGPFVRSTDGTLYNMAIIDDFSAFPWNIQLKDRGQASDKLICWAKCVMAETGVRIAEIQMDRGGCLSDRVRAFCETEGIALAATAEYTSKTNGRVERLHRTYLAKARAMRIASSCPPHMWCFFLDTAIYLQRYTPSKSTNRKTPWELFYGDRPDVFHLREIGCTAYCLILNKHNPKVYDRSKECTLIGYSRLTEGSYLFYHRETNCIIDTIHARFVESHQSGDIPSLLPSPVFSDEQVTTDGFLPPTASDEGEQTDSSLFPPSSSCISFTPVSRWGVYWR